MKYGIYILLIVCLCTCRSTKSTELDISSDYTSGSTKESIRIDSSRTEFEGQRAVSTDIDIDETIRTINFDTLGRVSSIQEHKRTTGSRQLDESSGRSGAVSVTEDKTEEVENTNANIDLKQKEDTKQDSRMVQGIEWIYVFIGLAFLVGIAILIYRVWKRLR